MFDLLGATVTPSATKSINKTAFLLLREKIMTTLALNIQTMSSREIAEVVNSRHDSVKRAIERLVEKGVISQPPLVDGEKAANGVVETQVYELNAFGSLGMVKQDFQIQVYDFLAHGIFSDYNGLLGLDFLEGTKFCIDTVENTITIN